MLLKIEASFSRPVDVSGRAWTRISKQAMLAVGLYWDLNFKMGHFEPAAEAKYGYKQRSAKYLARKQGRDGRGGMVVAGPRRYRVPGGGMLPLVLKGDLRSLVRPPHVPRAFPTRVKITLPGPAYLRMKPDPRYRNAPNLGEELVRTTPAELRTLAQVYEASVTKQIGEYRERIRLGGRS